MKNKYSYRVMWSEEDQAHIAECLEFSSLKAHGKTAESALRELEAVVEDVVADLQKSGEPIPEPIGTRKYRGQIPLRVPPEVHRKLVVEAAEEGVSLNQYLLTKVIG